MMSQPGQQTQYTYIVIDIALQYKVLPNISRSKGNQTMKFGQLIEYNQRNIFLQNLCRK